MTEPSLIEAMARAMAPWLYEPGRSPDATCCGMTREQWGAKARDALRAQVEHGPTKKKMVAVRELDWTSKEDVDWDDGYVAMLRAELGDGA